MSEPRRHFTVEFKQQAVELVLKEGLSVAEAARRLDVRPNLLRRWRSQLDQVSKGSHQVVQQTALEAECRRLREENVRLRMEREILKKRRPSSRRSRDEIPLHRRSPRPLAGVDSMRRADCLA